MLANNFASLVHGFTSLMLHAFGKEYQHNECNSGYQILWLAIIKTLAWTDTSGILSYRRIAVLTMLISEKKLEVFYEKFKVSSSLQEPLRDKSVDKLATAKAVHV